ncbi:hypothetical protein [Bergeyella cardium]|uniref:hypothetical protein n=1 Tax=Bergeyella cardium TaxID=1585976 RepID=UPI000EA296AA|nr:hypothetical protein [Bergeyella cardium]
MRHLVGELVSTRGAYIKNRERVRDPNDRVKDPVVAVKKAVDLVRNQENAVKNLKVDKKYRIFLLK